MSKIEGTPPPPAYGFGPAPGAGLAPAKAQPSLSVLAMLAVAAVVALLVLLGFMLPAQGDTEPARVGFRIGRTFTALFLPGLIAYVIAGRKKARKPNQFAVIFCVLAILFAGGNAVRSGNLGALFESPEQQVGRLMREASGVEPVHESMFAGKRRIDNGLREQFRNLIRVNHEYTEAVKNADISEIKKINSPESFVDPNYVAPALRQLHEVYRLDADQEEKVKEILGNLRHTLETEVGASNREGFLKGFDSGVAAQSATRRQAVTAERAWVDAVDEEYSYAAEHLADFGLNQTQLVIRDTTVRQEFNSRLRAQEEKRKEFLKAQEEFRKFQVQMLQKMGVAPKDVGAGQ